MEEAEASRPWRCSTNWTMETEESSLEGSISFETSEEDAPALTGNGSVLTRPASDDPPPCEVTVFLRRKHEIHRIYAKSTARTFEVYYSKDSQSDAKEYLCTVKCGPALSGSNSSVHSSEEETWVEVKSHQSSSSTDLSKENQMHYEATAEISDADPCFSLTLRFLSLQTKSSIHIEEIYILADPLDESSATQNSNTGTAGNFNASSMFAMLVPNLLQMSKSGLSNRLNDQYFSTDRIGNVEKVEDQTAKFQNLVTEKSNVQDSNPINTEKLEDQTAKFKTPVRGKINIQEPQNPIDKKDYVKQVDQETRINTETSNINIKQVGPTSQVEKLLETLVSKVENMETYFTKFEAKMVGPISNIETRLCNLEKKFDQFSTDLRSLKDNSVADGVAGHSRPGSEIEKRLFGLESRFNKFSENFESVKVQTKGNNSVADDVAGQSRPGFRAPDFISDDDSTDDDDLLNDNNYNVNNNNDNTTTNNNDNVSKRRPISIDGALASALAAFASGSKSDPPNPTVEIDSGDKTNDVDSVDQTGRVGEIPVKGLDSEGGIPLVFMDDVRIEPVSVSDPFLSFEGITEGLDQKTNELNGCEKEINELDRILDQIDELEQNSDRVDGFGKRLNEADRNLDGMNESEQNLGQIDVDLISETKQDEGFFCKSVIGEISDEEEEDLGFGSDLHRFACNSPLSETASEFESNFPTFNINTNDNNSTDSSFDENFLKSRITVDLSDSESTESGTFHKSTLKNSEIGDDLNFGVGSSFDQDLLGEIPGNVSSSNGPLIDLELEEDLGNVSETCQKNGNVEQFESLI